MKSPLLSPHPHVHAGKRPKWQDKCRWGLLHPTSAIGIQVRGSFSTILGPERTPMPCKVILRNDAQHIVFLVRTVDKD